MKLHYFFCVWLLCAAGISFAEDVKLADASASASVERTSAQNGFAISVVFNPVTTLDGVSNREMTEVLAQFYAEEALSSFLKSAKAITFSKVKSPCGTVKGEKTKLCFVVPVDAVIDAPVKTVEKREEVVGKKWRRGTNDAKTNLLDFRSTCFRDLRVAEALFAEEAGSIKSQKERTRVQQRIRSAVSELRRKIKADDDLFRSEKAELIDKADKVEHYLLSEVLGDKQRNDRTDREKALSIVDGVFKEPFGDLLKSDSILLTHGGARFIEMDDGAVAILAVGFAMADSEDREDIAELKASAELGRLKGGEESVVRNKLERQYRRVTNGDDVKESIETKRSSLTSVSSIDFHKTGETVGTWFSADRKRFFLAKGIIVHERSKE